MPTELLIAAAALAVVLTAVALTGVRVAQEYQRAVSFRLGRYHSNRGPGVYYLVPVIDWSRTIDMRTVTVAIEQQETITKDSVTVKINAVLWYRVTEPYKAVLEVADFEKAVYQIAQTSLRSIIGQHDLDEVLKERGRINDQLRVIVDKDTDPWGVTVEAVEMKDVEIPQSMQRAMAREAEAVREKRARLIKAASEREAAEQLAAASEVISRTPIALELRRMQMIAEVGAEQNTTTIVMMPSEFVSIAKGLAETAGRTQAAAEAVQ